MSNTNDFIIENGILKKYVGTGGEVVIPDGVTDIAPYAFNGTRIKRVTVSEGVLTIGSNAFSECKMLKEVILPKSLENIMCEAFLGCKKLEIIRLPENIKYVERSAFWGCYKDNIQVIAEENFDFSDLFYDSEERKALKSKYADVVPTSVVIPENISDLDQRTLINIPNAEGAHEIIIPANVSHIKPNAFAYCVNLKRIVLSHGSDAIEEYSFSQCDSLEEIIFSEAITEIPLGAFRRCRGMKTIHIPASVKKIDKFAFAECVNLKKIYVPKSVKSIGANSFWWSRKVTIHAPAGSYAEKYAKKNNIPFVAE